MAHRICETTNDDVVTLRPMVSDRKAVEADGPYIYAHAHHSLPRRSGRG